jgi:hypothetical protein
MTTLVLRRWVAISFSFDFLKGHPLFSMNKSGVKVDSLMPKHIRGLIVTELRVLDMSPNQVQTTAIA